MILAFLSVEYSTEKSDFNQVTFWDDRIMRSVKEQHVINLKKTRAEYPITDIHKNLK